MASHRRAKSKTPSSSESTVVATNIDEVKAELKAMLESGLNDIANDHKQLEARVNGLVEQFQPFEKYLTKARNAVEVLTGLKTHMKSLKADLSSPNAEAIIGISERLDTIEATTKRGKDSQDALLKRLDDLDDQSSLVELLESEGNTVHTILQDLQTRLEVLEGPVNLDHSVSPCNDVCLSTQEIADMLITRLAKGHCLDAATVARLGFVTALPANVEESSQPAALAARAPDTPSTDLDAVRHTVEQSLPAQPSETLLKSPLKRSVMQAGLDEVSLQERKKQDRKRRDKQPTVPRKDTKSIHAARNTGSDDLQSIAVAEAQGDIRLLIATSKSSTAAHEKNPQHSASTRNNEKAHTSTRTPPVQQQQQDNTHKAGDVNRLLVEKEDQSATAGKLGSEQSSSAILKQKKANQAVRNAFSNHNREPDQHSVAAATAPTKRGRGRPANKIPSAYMLARKSADQQNHNEGQHEDHNDDNIREKDDEHEKENDNHIEAQDEHRQPDHDDDDGDSEAPAPSRRTSGRTPKPTDRGRDMKTWMQVRAERKVR